MELELAEEKGDDAQFKLANYQHEVARGYSRSVQLKTWPFQVVKLAGEGAYKLEDMEGKAVANPWNAENLKKAYL